MSTNFRRYKFPKLFLNAFLLMPKTKLISSGELLSDNSKNPSPFFNAFRMSSDFLSVLF